MGCLVSMDRPAPGGLPARGVEHDGVLAANSTRGAPMNPTELCFAPAADLAAAIRAKRVSPTEAVEAVLDRIAAVNPSINALVTVTEDLARATARDIETRLARGEAAGPLAGVPVTIKDLIMVKGVRTTWGSRIFERFVSPEDAPAVERLRAAGAVIVGMTNSPEFGYRATT